jgi:hypothetical protein
MLNRPFTAKAQGRNENYYSFSYLNFARPRLPLPKRLRARQVYAVKY